MRHGGQFEFIGDPPSQNRAMKPFDQIDGRMGGWKFPEVAMQADELIDKVIRHIAIDEDVAKLPLCARGEPIAGGRGEWNQNSRSGREANGFPAGEGLEPAFP